VTRCHTGFNFSRAPTTLRAPANESRDGITQENDVKHSIKMIAGLLAVLAIAGCTGTPMKTRNPTAASTP